ncbi:hypothetical protein HAHI6034_07615 [Hathewaya histolytica]|uniref:ABC transporter permease n=1 Tax=Hathewaya histolytica TaxID=1498 RepID=A0A4U9QYN7_HATHI|nr:hypothetical protein [Hathewaya histolytica]VTQ82991.1 ABC transporter permease [Hathewaya histolytica]
MKNLKYAFHGLSSNLFISIIILIQVTTAFLFLDKSIKYNIKLKEDGNRILSLFKDKEPFRLREIISNPARDKMDQEEDSTGNVTKLFHYLKYNKDFTFTNFETGYIQIDNFKGGAKFLDDVPPDTDNPNYSAVKSLYLDYNFTKLFNIEVIDGRFFKKEDFDYTDEIPLILGSNYKGIYKLGDELTVRPGLSPKFIKGKVLGFLKKDYYFLDNIHSLTMLNLNNSILVPYSSIFDKKVNFIHSMVSINNGVIFAENKEKAMEYFNTINKEASKYTLYKFNYDGLRDIFNGTFITNLKEQIKMLNTIFLLIFIFCSTGIVTSLLSYIKKHSSEFGIHLLCGAKLSDIIYRIILQIGIIIAISFCFTTLLNIVYFKDLSTTLYLFLFSILAILILSIIPVVKILRLDINTLIVRKE